MRICLLGDFSSLPSEGYRNIALNLQRELNKEAEVVAINVWPPRIDNFIPLISQTRRAQPDIIHSFSAPTIPSQIITEIARTLSARSAKTVISCLNPKGLKILARPASRFAANITRPDLALTQNPEMERLLKEIGTSTRSLPNGVDLNRFKPVSYEEKMSLRRKYGIDDGKIIALHVGHLVARRGLRLFSQLLANNTDVQGVVVASSYFKPESEVVKDLNGSHCLIWRKHFEHIEEIYQLSDLYAFPVQTGASIFMPLSVMEAMACNLPTVSTEFDSLRYWFGESDGLFLAKNENDFSEAFEIMKNLPRIDVRSRLMGYSWSDISARLMMIYRDLLEAG